MKAHLLGSDEPLVEGEDYIARCGQTVAKAAFVFWLENGDVVGVSTLLFCGKCIEGPGYKRRYIYGMVDGEKAKHPEAEL